ncbi:A-kinase anchor protein 13-like [Macrosteles quadrilineatus]|uniref:A-kinase anchor protein 13-like n=1 Tax=Macrosteles quadrilineatus TaxID=74068 RepID=UPI0023E180F2|nr:A-kinase anchor protein 13-like [Macrosteles quadrilineatus]
MKANDTSLGFEGVLRQKDVEQALILEEKMALQLRLLAAAGMPTLPEPPSYCHLVTDDMDLQHMWKEVLSAVRKVNQLASSLYASGTNLSRSVSSVGEHQSETYVSPTLPKRAETFGGFDNANKDPGALNKGLFKKQHQQQMQQLQQIQQQQTQQLQNQLQLQAQQLQQQAIHQQVVQQQCHSQSGSREPSVSSSPVLTPDTGKSSPKLSLVLQEPWLGYNSDLPALLSLGHQQQLVALQLSHHVYTLSCIISQQMTSIDSLQAQLAACKAQLSGEETRERERRPVYRHNQQLEELRNLQDKLTQEKEAWQRDRETEERDLEDRREQLLRLQEQVRSEQADVTQQREQLYRRLEMLTSQGILISPNLSVVTSPPPSGEDHSPMTPDGGDLTPTLASDPPRRKADTAKWKQQHKDKASTLPLNLISATNQQKVATNVQIKQQLPLKLATKLGSGSSNTLPPGVGGPQQMLPLKLSSGVGERRSGGGYQRLNSPPDQPPQHSHTRHGSSPAMMQNVQSGEGRTGNKAGRTNTYPKLPERFRVRSPETQPQPPPSEEEVIFF